MPGAFCVHLFGLGVYRSGSPCNIFLELHAFTLLELYFSVAVFNFVAVATFEAETFGFEEVPSLSDGFPAE